MFKCVSWNVSDGELAAVICSKHRILSISRLARTTDKTKASLHEQNLTAWVHRLTH